MKAPELNNLPPPLERKTGWPWTETTPPLPPTMPDGSEWPKISIVTPSFNQGQFIEETIRSVLLQGYPNLEYIIIDGGSTDGSVEIIKKYEPWLTYWVSEKDRGQSHAINKGFERSTGEVMAWINSDDYYAPYALNHTASLFKAYDTLWVAGNCYKFNLDGTLKKAKARPPEDPTYWYSNFLYCQPGVFWRRELWKLSEGIDEALSCSFDYDLFLKFSRIQPFAYWTDNYLAYFRIHPASKTSKNSLTIIKEDDIIHQRYRYEDGTIFDNLKISFRKRNRKYNAIIQSPYYINHPRRLIKLVIRTAPWKLFSSELLKIAQEGFKKSIRKYFTFLFRDIRKS